jgi:hypothetical protein
VYATGGVGIANNEDPNGNREYASWFGLGVHLIPRGGKLLLDLDAYETQFATLSHAHYEGRQVETLRLQIGYQVAKHLLVVAGPTLNVQVAKAWDDRRPRGVGFAEQVWTSGHTVVRMYPGLSAGLEF